MQSAKLITMRFLQKLRAFSDKSVNLSHSAKYIWRKSGQDLTKLRIALSVIRLFPRKQVLKLKITNEVHFVKIQLPIWGHISNLFEKTVVRK